MIRSATKPIPEAAIGAALTILRVGGEGWCGRGQRSAADGRERSERGGNTRGSRDSSVTRDVLGNGPDDRGQRTGRVLRAHARAQFGDGVTHRGGIERGLSRDADGRVRGREQL